MTTALTVKNINKYFEEVQIPEMKVLEDINLEVKDGEFLIMVGPSGSGKSTLLRIMSGLEAPNSGEVILGEGISKKDIAFVFQRFALLPWLTVYENIELGLHHKGVEKRVRQDIVNRELKQFGLEKFAQSYPRHLSGGMRQRVGIARALAKEPKIIFMDEPFSELDSFTATELRRELLEAWSTRKPTTVIMVTHFVSDAVELGDRVVVLTPRPAKLERIVENNIARPRDLASQQVAEMQDLLTKLIRP